MYWAARLGCNDSAVNCPERWLRELMHSHDQDEIFETDFACFKPSRIGGEAGGNP